MSWTLKSRSVFGWNRQPADYELNLGLSEDSIDATNRGFNQCVRLNHFRRVDREYKLTEKYGHPYVVLGLGCLGALASWSKKKGIDKRNILCIFEDGDEGQALLIRMAGEEGFDAIAQSKRDIRAFDACDLAAWKSRTMVDDAWERLLPMKDPQSGGRLMNTLGQIEGLAKEPKGVAMYSINALIAICRNQEIPQR